MKRSRSSPTGWAYLAAGDLARAVDHANLALAKSPRSLAAITLLVHADIMRAGALTGLDRYEQWLGGRAPDDGYLLRHVARASLLEIWRSPDLPSRVQALKHLSKDGDADARAELTRQAYKGGITELRCLAELGDEGAVRQLIGVLKQSSKQLEAAALIAQYEPDAARATLDRLLADGTPPVRIQAARVLAERVASDFATLRKLMKAGDAQTRVRAAERILELTQ